MSASAATSATRYRACPLCEAICGLEFRFVGERLHAIHGDPQDPLSRGHICPKGNAIIDLENDPDRLRTPMQRVGNDWRPISWEAAFALAAEKLAAIQASHGDDAVGLYLGNPNVHHFGHIAYFPKLARLLHSKNIYSASSVDQWPHHLVSYLMFGHQFLIPIPDLDRSDYLLMLGANPLASNGSLLTAPGIHKRLKSLSQRGRLVVIDPRRSETAASANEHHFIRPGSDALFLIALLQAMQAECPPRIDRYLGKLAGFDAAMQAIASIDTTAVAAHTGISAECIRKIATDFLQARHAVAYGRMGVSTQIFGSLAQWLLQLVNLYAGQLDAEGGSLPNEPAIPLTGPGTQAGSYGRWKSRVRGLPELSGELPVATLIDEIETPGAGQIRALLTVAGNPVLSTPNGQRLDAALGQLDFMISIDVYINETTRHADLILPPAWFLSQPHFDLIFNGFAVRRYARLSPPIHVQAADECADWQIANRLASALAAATGREWRDLPAPRELIQAGLARGPSGLTLADLDAAPHGIDLGPLQPSLLRRLQTASGNIECAPPLMLQELERARCCFASVATEDPTLLRLIGRRELRNNNSWMHNAARLIKGKPRHQLWMHPDDLRARGLLDGMRVQVCSKVGKVVTEVRADADLMPGVVSLPHGYGHTGPGVRLTLAGQLAGVSINDLTDPSLLDGASGNAALNGVPVSVAAAVAD